MLTLTLILGLIAYFRRRAARAVPAKPDNPPQP
jgi:hypothetical protein